MYQTKFDRNLPSSFRNFQIETLRKHYSDSESPFNLDCFAYFSSNHVNSVFNDTITLRRLNKKVKSQKNDKNSLQWYLNPGPLE